MIARQVRGGGGGEVLVSRGGRKAAYEAPSPETARLEADKSFARVESALKKAGRLDADQLRVLDEMKEEIISNASESMAPDINARVIKDVERVAEAASEYPKIVDEALKRTGYKDEFVLQAARDDLMKKRGEIMSQALKDAAKAKARDFSDLVELGLSKAIGEIKEALRETIGTPEEEAINREAAKITKDIELLERLDAEYKKTNSTSLRTEVNRLERDIIESVGEWAKAILKVNPKTTDSKLLGMAGELGLDEYITAKDVARTRQELGGRETPRARVRARPELTAMERAEVEFFGAPLSPEAIRKTKDYHTIEAHWHEVPETEQDRFLVKLIKELEDPTAKHTEALRAAARQFIADKSPDVTELLEEKEERKPVMPRLAKMFRKVALPLALIMGLKAVGPRLEKPEPELSRAAQSELMETLEELSKEEAARPAPGAPAEAAKKGTERVSKAEIEKLADQIEDGGAQVRKGMRDSAKKLFRAMPTKSGAREVIQDFKDTQAEQDAQLERALEVLESAGLEGKKEYQAAQLQEVVDQMEAVKARNAALKTISENNDLPQDLKLALIKSNMNHRTKEIRNLMGALENLKAIQ
jgi:hypothetical protein